MSKITKFWVVTKPTKNSELEDILFKSDISQMELQFRGGLTAKEIIGLYMDKDEALGIAQSSLAKIHN